MKKAAWIRLVSVFLIAALLFTGCGWNKVEGDDLRYPCKWKTKGKNTVVLEIKAGTAPEGYEWKTGEYDANILSVSDPAIDKKGNVKYTIESVNLGKTIVPFSKVVTDIPERSKLYNGQAPDSFSLPRFLEMQNNLTEEQKKMITGTSQICTMNHQPIYIIDGDPLNFKLTTDGDLRIFKSMIEG